LEHERAGHAGVVGEVPVEVPVVRRHRGFGAQVATAPGAAAGIDVCHGFQQQHAARVDARAPHVRPGHRPLRTETLRRPPAAGRPSATARTASRSKWRLQLLARRLSVGDRGEIEEDVDIDDADSQGVAPSTVARTSGTFWCSWNCWSTTTTAESADLLGGPLP